MRVDILASGSRGNAILISGSGSSILIDAGLPVHKTLEGIRAANVRPRNLRALIITHEHIDHSFSASAISRRLNLTVMANRPTLAALNERGNDGFFGVSPFETGRAFDAGGFTVTPFPVPHDCAEGVGLVVEQGPKSLGICTDLGFATSLVKERLKGVDALVVESNHDPGMLMEGTYPWHVKQRIKGRQGHLSNAQCADLLKELATPNLRAVVLAHLSQENNRPELALSSAMGVLKEVGADSRVELFAASQDEPLSIAF